MVLSVQCLQVEVLRSPQIGILQVGTAQIGHGHHGIGHYGAPEQRVNAGTVDDWANSWRLRALVAAVQRDLPFRGIGINRVWMHSFAVSVYYISATRTEATCAQSRVGCRNEDGTGVLEIQEQSARRQTILREDTPAFSCRWQCTISPSEALGTPWDSHP